MTYHSLLARQIKKHLGADEPLPDAILSLLQAVNDTYEHNDRDRGLLEHSTQLSLDELSELNSKLREEQEKQQVVIDQIKDSIRSLKDTEELSKAELDDVDILSITAVLKKEVNKRQLAEHKLKTSIENLQEANAELESIAYVASHDLKTPLRGISSLVKWLMEDYQDLLKEEGMDHLHLLTRRVKRMYKLIDSISIYTGMSNVNLSLEEVDIKQLVGNIKTELENAYGPVQLTTRGLFSIKANKNYLALVFKNLIENAVVHNQNQDYTVSIGMSREEEGWSCRITDTGSGIGAPYHDKVFKLFQTLELKDKNENIGMGLPIARKAIETMGGTLDLQSEPGKTTTFYFQLPNQIETIKSEQEDEPVDQREANTVG